MEYAIKKNGLYESIEFKTNIIQTKGRCGINLLAKLDGNDFVCQKVIPRIETITELSLPMTVTYKLSSKMPFSYAIPFVLPHYYDKSKVEDYLYEITYGNIDYDYAYKNIMSDALGGCSSIRNGKWFGRNFDWLYNHQVQFVVHTPSSLDHYAVLGVSGIVPNILQSNVENDIIIYEGVDMFKLLPFYLLDGINEKGVFCTHNVVPLDDADTPTAEVTARVEERDRVPAVMLPRFVLDKFATAEQAVTYLRDYTTVYFPDTMLSEWKYQSHVLLGDTDSTYVIEFTNGEMRVLKTNYITNFRIADVSFATDGTVQYPPTQYGVESMGAGLERWDMIATNYKRCGTREGMRELLDMLTYSNCYGEPFWCSELVGKTDDDGETITVDTDPSLCVGAILEAQSAYESRSRDEGDVWISCHSSVYDIPHRCLYIRNQENETEYHFDI